MSKLDKNQLALLWLVRKSIVNCTDIVPQADWDIVEDLAAQHGVLWMLYLGAKQHSQQIPSEKIRTWRGMMYASALRNEQLNGIQAEIVSWLMENNIRTAVLKGTSCSRYYTIPEARSLGDIDILVDKDSMDVVGNFLLHQGFHTSTPGHPFHVEYYKDGTTIEVHHACTDVPDSVGGRRAAQEMSKFLNDVCMVSMDGMVFPVLSESHQALMLLLHMERHMMGGGIGLRQLCDWAMFVNNSSALHWKQATLELLRRCGLLKYACVVTKACVDYLGVDDSHAAWCLDIESKLSNAFISDVFYGGEIANRDSEGLTNIFSERSILGQQRQSRMKSIIAMLNRLAFREWPVVQKYRILLPLFWLYIPIRYWIRGKKGLRSKVNIRELWNSSTQRKKLFERLELYRVQE